MKPLTNFRGIAVPLLEDDIDTDQLCPKQYLTRLERAGFEDALFSDRRFTSGGAKNPDFVLNRPIWCNASILIAGENFGCGSSREHAVWALVDFGIRCVIAPSFGDILFQNCVNSGLLAITLPRETVARLADISTRNAGVPWTVDLENKRIVPAEGDPIEFDIDPTRRMRLLAGLDEIGLTLRYQEAITDFEEKQSLVEPWLWPAPRL